MMFQTIVRGVALAGAVLIWRAATAADAVARIDAGDPIVILNVADLHVTDDASMADFRKVIEFANGVIRPPVAYIAGDTPDGGTAAQYKAYKAVMDTLKCPVLNVAGDHEAKGGGMEFYKQTLGEPTWVCDIGGWRIVGLNSMGLDAAQLDWAAGRWREAKEKGRPSLAFIHHNLAGLKDKAMADRLLALLKENGVKLVLAGHTHNNTVINDGAMLQITTTSIKAPRGKDPRGYALVTLDGGRVAWHFVPVDQRPVVAACNPISKLMATGPEGVVRGTIEVRVKAYDSTKIAGVTASIDGGSPMALKSAGDLWTVSWDSATAGDGEHALKIVATNADGVSASEEFAFLVSQDGKYLAAPATVTDGGAGGGGKAPKDAKDAKDAKGGKGKKEPVDAAQLPAAVVAVIRQQAGDARIEKIQKETKDGAELYTAKWTLNELERELKVAADGKILETRNQISVADLPAQVRRAVEQSLRNAKDVQVRSKTKTRDGATQTEYEVKAQVDGEKQDLRILPDGTVQQKGPKSSK